MKSLDTRQVHFASDFEALLDEARQTTASVDAAVAAIIAEIRARGDAALCDYTERFDRVRLTPDTMRVTADEIEQAASSVSPELLAALDLAARRIELFHRAQMPVDMRMCDDEGVRMGMRWTPLDSAGLYVPGGKAAYPSSVLMNAIPARVAGVGRIAMCVPCPDGRLAPLVLAAAKRAGITEIFAWAVRRLWPPWRTALRPSRRSTGSWGLAMPMSPRRSARCSGASASMAWRAPRKS